MIRSQSRQRKGDLDGAIAGFNRVLKLGVTTQMSMVGRTWTQVFGIRSD